MIERIVDRIFAEPKWQSPDLKRDAIPVEMTLFRFEIAFTPEPDPGAPTDFTTLEEKEGSSTTETQSASLPSAMSTMVQQIRLAADFQVHLALYLMTGFFDESLLSFFGSRHGQAVWHTGSTWSDMAKRVVIAMAKLYGTS